MSDTVFTGRVWRFGHDINTDLVIPNFAVMMPLGEQLQYCFSANRPGWVDEMAAGDVLVVGRNFGVGSARNIGAVFHALGIGGVVAESFNGLGLRNCINAGLPSLACPGVLDVFEEGETAEVDWTTGAVRNSTSGATATGNPIPPQLQDIILGGGVEGVLRREGYLAEPSSPVEIFAMTAATPSVTEQVAQWVVTVPDDDVPAVAVERVRDLVLDSLGNQFAGMAASTGRLLSAWVRAQGGSPVCAVTAQDFKTTPAFATLLNGAASHALENDDIATFSSHPNSPLTAAALALGEQLGSSGRDVVTAWAIGWEVTAQTMKVCLGPRGNELINRGWFNQGFQETLGVAALAARLHRLDVEQTRHALGHAASAMGGLMKNRGTDTKGFTAGSAAMHGVMAAELAATGFTADRDILDGELGVARLLGLENGDPQKVLDGLGSWDLATRGSTIRLHACCGAAHWSMDALQQIVRARPLEPDDIATIEVEIPAFLTDMLPVHRPQAGLEAKYSLEYCVGAIALDGRAGVNQYTDEAVQRPEAQRLVERVTTVPVDGPLESRVVVTLTDGEQLEATVNRTHGNPADPLTRDERLAKFDESAALSATEDQRSQVIDFCARLEALDDVRELAAAIADPGGTSHGA